MRGPRLSAASICIVAAAALVAPFSGGTAGGALAKAPPQTPVEPEAQIDIELAFDTTASMGPSIERAKWDGASIMERVRDALPDTRFAVVSFRDYGNPSGDYEVLQPMTADLPAVQAAFTKLRPARNPSPLNTSAEEYNLVLHKSYTDAGIDWRSRARKVVVVIGDAQPHGAGTSGLRGCTDTSVDHYGLNTADVLAGMRAAERTLVMIRQSSPETTASLGCYEAMAERAYVGGATRNGGDADLANPILALIQSAVAPVTLGPDLGIALPGGSAGYTATVSNPNAFALSLRSVRVALPAGFRHRSDSSTGVLSSDAGARTKVSRPIERVIRPSEKVSVHFTVSAPKRRGRFAAQAVVQLQLPGGHEITSTGRASLRITPRPRTLVVAARAQRPVQPSGAVALSGAVRIAFRPGARTLRAGRLLAGRLVLRSGPGRSLALRVRSFRIVAFGSPTVLRLKLEVERVRGMPGCSPRSSGSAILVDNQRFNATGLRRDTVVTRFSVNCRIGSGRWLNLGGAARSAVTATAR
jgi:hypothetical protein